MNVPQPETSVAGSVPAPHTRLAALHAESRRSGDSQEIPSSEDVRAPGPGHRWEVAARTRVPHSLLLLALAAVAVLAWAVLGPGRGADEGSALAEVDVAGSSAATAPAAPSSGALSGAPSPAPSGAAPSRAPAGTGPAPAEAAGAGGTLLVHVTGEVERPGVVEVAPGGRVVDAVEAAGGLTGDAVIAGVNLAAPVADGQQVLIPGREGGPAAVAPAPGASSADAPVPSAPSPAGAGVPGAPAAGGLLDLNAATAADLEALPRVGPVLAERIVAFRDGQGGFTSAEELDAVPGVGPAVLEALLPLVTV